MKSNFNYSYTQQATGQLYVEDLGNCAIIANTDQGVEYYLIIKTELGTSLILEAGPYILDSNMLAKSVNISFKRIEYNEGKLSSIIEKFLNNPYRNITQAREVDENEIYPYCINIIDYVKYNQEWC